MTNTPSAVDRARGKLLTACILREKLAAKDVHLPIDQIMDLMDGNGWTTELQTKIGTALGDDRLMPDTRT